MLASLVLALLEHEEAVVAAEVEGGEVAEVGMDIDVSRFAVDVVLLRVGTGEHPIYQSTETKQFPRRETKTFSPALLQVDGDDDVSSHVTNHINGQVVQQPAVCQAHTFPLHRFVNLGNGHGGQDSLVERAFG